MIRKRLTLQSIGLLWIAFMAFCSMPAQAAVITHNIGIDSLIIAGNSTNDYIITGTTTTNYVRIGSGYQGTITLQNVNISSTSTINSAITVLGLYNRSNLSPVTKVNVILEGTNTLYANGGYYRPAFQVDQGAQISISAIDPSDNTSGTLSATGSTVSGSGIGAPSYTSTANLGQGTAIISDGTTKPTAGGNIIISSGTVTAKGGHAAGIGGGWYTYYNGIIAIYGGIVYSSATSHAAGIGSGCPRGLGVVPEYAPNSAIIVLPPASITAVGAPADKSLAGTAAITYIGDPTKPKIDVHTQDMEPNADIYADLSATPSVASVFGALAIPLDVTTVKFGNTGSTGTYTFHARLDQPVTFFTNASSSQPATQGRPYGPVPATVANDTIIILPLLNIGIAFEETPSVPLLQGYTTAQATTNAYRLKVTYNDNIPLSGMTYKLQDGAATDFKGLTFYDTNGTTVIAAPATLTNGTVFYIQVPVKDGKPLNIYRDVLLIKGSYGGVQTGDIRQIVTQRVVMDDTNTNSYIKVTATPPTFATNNAATATATLTLNITHGTQTVPYNNMEVSARYLITTQPDYDLAIAATPLSGWAYLNVPLSDGVNATTTVPFAGKAAGTYYIHWYVESTVVYAHSKTVVSPTATYGGFGPYVIDMVSPTVAIQVDGQPVTKNITNLAALPVTLTFSEAIKSPGTNLTAADFEILPAGIAAISNIAVVSNSGDASFTATLTPQPALYNGQSFTIRLKTSSVTDLAGNYNTASNLITVRLVNTTKPVVTFKNAAMYATLRPTFTIEVSPEDFGLNVNIELSQTPGGAAIIAGANLSSLFTITPQGGAPLTAGYTAAYSKSGSGATAKGIVTITFTSDLINSTNYTVALTANRFYNKLRNGNIAGQSVFTIAQPDFSGTAAGLSADPSMFGYTGGITALTIKGEDLKMYADDGILSLRIACPEIGYNSGPITSGFTVDEGLDVVTKNNVAIPANANTYTVSYTFVLYQTINGEGEVATGKSCVVMVEPDAAYIMKVTNTTTSTTDLTFGYSAGQAQVSGIRQNITVTNNGAQALNNLSITMIDPDGIVFTNTAPAPVTGLAPGNTATFYAYLQTGQKAGSYAGDGDTKVMVSATQAITAASVSNSDFLVTQIVNPKISTNPAGEANVTGNPPPSTTWSNLNTVDLTASTLTTGDFIKDWKYAVMATNVAPDPTDPAWTSISGGTATDTYTFPAGTDGDRYIFWQMNTNNVTDIAGQVQNGGVKVYNIDLVAPTVTGITSERMSTNETTFNVRVTFSEPVSVADASKFVLTNATAGAPTGTGTPVNGLYTTYAVPVTANPGLVMGDLIVFSVQANAVKDRANNLNPAASSIYDIGILYDNINPVVTVTTPDYTVNSNFVVTIVFSKPVTGLTESDLIITNGAVLTGSLSGSGDTYTVTINTAASNSGMVHVSVPDNVVTDAASNGNKAGGLAVDYRKPTDRIAPVLSYTGPDYENGAFDVHITFERYVTGLTAADFVYLTADFATPVLTGGGKSYVLTLTPLADKDATTTVQLPAGIEARDEYGNELLASNIVSVNYDTRQPLVSSITTEGDVSVVHFDPFTVTIVFDEPNMHSFDANQLDLTNLDYLGLVSGPVIVGSTTQFEISVQVSPNVLSQSTLILAVGVGTAWDKADNPNKASAGNASLSLRFVDDTPPHVINITPSDNKAPIEGELVFTFDEPINPTSNGTVWLEDFGNLNGGVWLNNTTLSVPYGILADDMIYTVYISGYKDLDGNPMIPAAASFGTLESIIPEILRPVVIMANDGLVTDPEAGQVIYINSHTDFVFEVSSPQGDLEGVSVKTGIPIRDKEGIHMNKNEDGSYTVTIVEVTEPLTITVSFSPTANETIDSDKVWAHERMLYVQTGQPGTLFVYTLAGALYKQEKIEDFQTEIPLETGFYTVVFNGESYVIVIK